MSSMNASCFAALRILADGEPHSAERLGRATGLSPAGVHDALRAIEALGLRVSGDLGPGYRLAEALDLLDSEALVAKVKQVSPELRVEVLDECPSTNSVLVGRVPAGAAHGTVLVCEHQNAGRGRRGNTWIGSIGGSLAFSILWRFPGRARALAALSLAVGVGAAQGLERQGVRAVRVKWPNDLYCGESKLGGILIETSGETSGPSAAVIGVGINTRITAPVRELIGRSATDVASHSEAVPRRSELLVALLESLAGTLTRFSDEGFAPFREEWLRRHLWQGRQVALMQASQRVAEGEVVGVAEDGALMLASGGGIQRFHNGEMSLRVA
jgi:BirA family transcriptional regulator, biotin operon repressor / biotin---[acetyl-CoA-carboxylase] ligase